MTCPLLLRFTIRGNLFFTDLEVELEAALRFFVGSFIAPIQLMQGFSSIQ
jgi:hypothetical protein